MNQFIKYFPARTLLAMFTIAFITASSEAQLKVTSVKPTVKTSAAAQPAKTWPAYANVFYRNKQGAFYKDPVCGMYGAVTEATPVSEVAGKSYCFDSDACKKKFEQESHKYIATSIMPTRVISVEGQKVTVIDPVNSSRVELKKETPFKDYMSKRYYFSADSSAKMFEKNPHQYSINAKLKKPNSTKRGN